MSRAFCCIPLSRKARALLLLMFPDLKSHPINRIRLMSFLDGISFLVLLGIAMPLKYLAGEPLAVRIVGSIHGVFFLGLCAALLDGLVRKKISFQWCCLVFLCAFFPFAPFFLDRKLRKLPQ